MEQDIRLETPRLVLKTVSGDDLADVALSWNLYGDPISLEEAGKQVARMQANHRQNAPSKLVHLCLAVIRKDAPGIIGWCGLDHTDRTKPNPVLFYLLRQSCWGKGFATEAARALLDYAFRILDLPQIDSACASNNLASKSVMEKIGMRYVGLDTEGGHSFALTRTEYQESE